MAKTRKTHGARISGSFVERVWKRAEYLLARKEKKAAAEAGEKYQKPTSQVVPNRETLRLAGIGIGQKYGRPFGRLTRSKLTPASINSHVHLRHTSETGRVRDMRVPRDQVVRKDQA